MGAVIFEDNKVLLSKRKIDPNKGSWDIPGGFIDPGETAHQALKREIKEELGVDIEIRKLIGFFPDTYGQKKTPTLNIFFYVKLKNKNFLPADDVQELKWFALNKLPKNLAFKNTKDCLQKVVEANRSL